MHNKPELEQVASNMTTLREVALWTRFRRTSFPRVTTLHLGLYGESKPLSNSRLKRIQRDLSPTTFPALRKL